MGIAGEGWKGAEQDRYAIGVSSIKGQEPDQLAPRYDDDDDEDDGVGEQ